jgi:hypothetical protein
VGQDSVHYAREAQSPTLGWRGSQIPSITRARLGPPEFRPLRARACVYSSQRVDSQGGGGAPGPAEGPAGRRPPPPEAPHRRRHPKRRRHPTRRRLAPSAAGNQRAAGKERGRAASPAGWFHPSAAGTTRDPIDREGGGVDTTPRAHTHRWLAGVCVLP